MKLDVVYDGEIPNCPICKRKMARNGFRWWQIRICGVIIRIKVQQFICLKCRKDRQNQGQDEEKIQYSQRGVPDGLYGYKLTPAAILFACGKLDEQENLNPRDPKALAEAQTQWQKVGSGCDESTLDRWKIWFRAFKTAVIGALRSLAQKINCQRLRDRADHIDAGRASRTV